MVWCLILHWTWGLKHQTMVILVVYSPRVTQVWSTSSPPSPDFSWWTSAAERCWWSGPLSAPRSNSVAMVLLCGNTLGIWHVFPRPNWRRSFSTAILLFWMYWLREIVLKRFKEWVGTGIRKTTRTDHEPTKILGSNPQCCTVLKSLPRKQLVLCSEFGHYMGCWKSCWTCWRLGMAQNHSP